MLHRGKSDLLRAIPTNGIAGHLHIRLCHLCLNLNESEAEILHCERCQRPLIFDLEQMIHDEQDDQEDGEELDDLDDLEEPQRALESQGALADAEAAGWGPYDDSSEGTFELVTEGAADNDIPSDEEFDGILGDYRRKFIHRLAGLSVLW